MKFPQALNDSQSVIRNVLSSLILASGVSQAVAAPPFTGDTAGTFNNPVGDAGMVNSGEGTSHFEWGLPTDDPNTLDFTGVVGFSVPAETTFKVGTLLYHNGVTVVSPIATGVGLDLLVDFTDPLGLNRTFTYPLSFVTTPNTGDPSGDADFVTLNPVASTTFTDGGHTYTLHLGFDNATANAAFLAGGGLEFHVLETESASVDVTGIITTDLRGIPDGGSTFALMALSLGSVAGLRRRLISK